MKLQCILKNRTHLIVSIISYEVSLESWNANLTKHITVIASIDVFLKIINYIRVFKTVVSRLIIIPDFSATYKQYSCSAKLWLFK